MVSLGDDSVLCKKILNSVVTIYCWANIIIAVGRNENLVLGKAVAYKVFF